MIRTSFRESRLGYVKKLYQEPDLEISIKNESNVIVHMHDDNSRLDIRYSIGSVQYPKKEQTIGLALRGLAFHWLRGSEHLIQTIEYGNAAK